MPVTPQPPDQQYGQLITDETVLERLFREHYPRWIADAKNRLGTDAATAAPRVVSKAFHLAWQDRKRFHSMEELDAFLGAQIHHGATREISRRAGLHRMDHHEGLGGAKTKHETHEMTVDEAWDRLQHTLAGGAPEAYRKRASAARHEAAEHVKELARERNWKPTLIIGAVVIAVALGVIVWVQKAGASRAITSALAAPDARKVETSYGQQANIPLHDGTIVRVGPETKLTIPSRFGPELRAVKIEGAASFEVKQAMEKPFEVRIGPAAVLARGTVFTVRKYPDDSNVVVHVKEGTVDVLVGEAIRNVATGMSYVVSNTGEIRVPSAEELAEASTWADGTVSIHGRTLRQALPQLKRWYGLDIKVPDSRLLDRPVYVSAKLDSPREAIAAVEKSGGVKWGYIGENMVFQDTVPTRRSTKRR